MKIITICIILIFVLYSCSSKNKIISIWIENNSSTERSIEITTYINDSLVDKRLVFKDTISVHFLPFDITLKKELLNTNLVFKFIKTNDTSRCVYTLNKGALDSSILLHVNYKKIVFKKDNILGVDTLKRDTLIDKEFYCEKLNTPKK